MYNIYIFYITPLEKNHRKKNFSILLLVIGKRKYQIENFHIQQKNYYQSKKLICIQNNQQTVYQLHTIISNPLLDKNHLPQITHTQKKNTQTPNTRKPSPYITHIIQPTYLYYYKTEI